MAVIKVDDNTKNSFDAIVSKVMQSAPRDIRITQDYVIRQMIAATIEKMEHQASEQK